MKKNIAIASLLTLCVGYSLSVSADEATAGQMITTTVEKVLLISLDDNFKPELSPTAPSVAGENFGAWAVSNNSSGVLVTSNVDNAQIKLQSNFDFSAQNIKLLVGFNNAGSQSFVPLTNTTEVLLGTIGNIATGVNRATSPVQITFIATNFTDSTQVPSHGSYNATLTYTISEPL